MASQTAAQQIANFLSDAMSKEGVSYPLSACLAQAHLESRGFTSELCVKHRNIFGMMVPVKRHNHTGKVNYPNGTFSVFPDWRTSCLDYIQRQKNFKIRSTSDPVAYLTATAGTGYEVGLPTGEYVRRILPHLKTYSSASPSAPGAASSVAPPAGSGNSGFGSWAAFGLLSVLALGAAFFRPAAATGSAKASPQMIPRPNVPFWLLPFAIIGFILFKLYKLINVQPPKGAAIQTAIEEKQSAGMKSTYPELQYRNLADSIYENLKTSAVQDDKAKAKGYLYYVYNDLDFLTLQTAYGKRQLYNFGIPDGAEKDLTATLASEFPSEYKTEINNLFATRGVSYRI